MGETGTNGHWDRADIVKWGNYSAFLSGDLIMIGPLAPGECYAKDLIFTSGTPYSGSVEDKMIADYFNNVSEYNENNNVSWLQ